MALRAPAHPKEKVLALWSSRQMTLAAREALPEPTPEDLVKIQRAIGWGIEEKPAQVGMQVARWAGIPFWRLCAYMRHETADGTMKIGSDPTWFIGQDLRAAGIPVITTPLFVVYRQTRDEFGPGGWCQGIGSMQLTHWTIQNRADQLGGCENLAGNLMAGAEWIAVLEDQGLTPREVAERYNGSTAYADRHMPIEAEAKQVILGR